MHPGICTANLRAGAARPAAQGERFRLEEHETHQEGKDLLHVSERKSERNGMSNPIFVNFSAVDCD